MRLLVVSVVVFGWVFSGGLAAGAPAIPREAQTVIRQVNQAAKIRNFGALRRIMTDEFIWSFGGDSDAGQALAAWNEDPKVLKELYRVTGMECAMVEKGIVECPKHAGINYRAGFKNTELGWRMIYFVAGD